MPIVLVLMLTILAGCHASISGKTPDGKHWDCELTGDGVRVYTNDGVRELRIAMCHLRD